MLSKKNLTYLKETKELAKLRKTEDKSKALIEDTSFLLEDESTETLLVRGNNILYYKNLD